jgi:surfeit locus 1 family protein
MRVDPSLPVKSYPFPPWLRALTLVAIPIIAVGMLGLGFWQLSRLLERRTANARIEARLALAPVALEQLDLGGDLSLLEYRPVTVRGTFDYAHEIVWRNQAYQGAPGVHIITPLRLSDRTAVLVDRGWIPALAADRVTRAAYQIQTGEAAISGLVRLPGQRRWDFEPQDTPASGEDRLDAWFFLNVPRIQTQVPYALLPLVVQQAPATDPSTLPIRTYDLQLDDGPHASYAFQWFAFAAIAIFGPLIYWWRTRRR